MSKSPDRLVILTGAGISAESGLPTFRGADGLWEGHRVEDVASPVAFARDPELVHRFYNLRRAALRTVEPNAAHLSLARLEAAWRGSFLLVTQNVDDLHDRAGSSRLLHMHGELIRARCKACRHGWEWRDDLSPDSICPSCGKSGRVRPDIVWFGEEPLHLGEIFDALSRASLFIAIGTSGHVYPAAGFVDVARGAGARAIEINLADTAASAAFDERRTGPATDLVPALVEELLAAQSVG